MNPKTCLILMTLATIVPESHQSRLPANFPCKPVEDELQLFRSYFDLYNDNITSFRTALSYSLHFFNMSQAYLDPYTKVVSKQCKQ